MKFEIKNRFTGSIIFSIETDSWKLAVEAALKSSANLSCADLRYADLRYADLRGANLRCANLSCANLSDANLSYADLRYADLRYADLRGANLSCANLSDANLSYANLRCANLSCANLSDANLSYADLRYADLRGANLSCANLRCANLSYADLSDAVGVNKYLTTPLYSLLDQTGEVIAYKLVNADGLAPFKRGITYKIGEEYTEPNANTNELKECAEGLNVATLDWCLKNWLDGQRILLVSHTVADIAAIPIGSDGKYRVKRLKVVGEKNLADLNWPPPEPEAK